MQKNSNRSFLEVVPEDARLEITKLLLESLSDLVKYVADGEIPKGGMGVFDPCIKTVFRKHNSSEIAVKLLAWIEKEFFLLYEKHNSYSSHENPSEYWRRQMSELLSRTEERERLRSACETWFEIKVSKKQSKKIKQGLRDHWFEGPLARALKNTPHGSGRSVRAFQGGGASGSLVDR